MKVSVVMAFPEHQQVMHLDVAASCDARQAVQQAVDNGLRVEYPGFDVATAPLGIHGIRVDDDTKLHGGDRVEIYRPLQQDPMELRRQRAKSELRSSSVSRK